MKVIKLNDRFKSYGHIKTEIANGWIVPSGELTLYCVLNLSICKCVDNRGYSGVHQNLV